MVNSKGVFATCAGLNESIACGYSVDTRRVRCPEGSKDQRKRGVVVSWHFRDQKKQISPWGRNDRINRDRGGQCN